MSDYEKDTIYELQYSSSTMKDCTAQLGTIEGDACGHYGNFSREIFRGKKIFDILLQKQFATVLDVGAGKLEATSAFIDNDKTVDICDFDDGLYYSATEVDKTRINQLYIGDFLQLQFEKEYDAVWCAHVLEHQLNPNLFLKKLFSLVKEDGYLTVIIPPRKPIIVGGHVSIWNAGLLLYHLIHAGFDCRDAIVRQYDYNIGVIIQKRTIKDFPHIHYDRGDLIKLKNYFPIVLQKQIETDSFNGDIIKIN